MSFRTWFADLQVARTFDRLQREWHRSPRRRHTSCSCVPAEVLEVRSLLSSYTAASVSQLIADMKAANANGGVNTITLAANTAFDLTAVNNTTNGANGLPVVRGKNGAANLTIIGNGDTIERSAAAGTPAFRLFDVANGSSLTLENVTLQNGLAKGSGNAADGGAIYNQGSLTLIGATVQNNFAIGSNGLNGGGGKNGSTFAAATDSAGGGVWSSGALTLQDLTLSSGGPIHTLLQSNTAQGGKGGYFANSSNVNTATNGGNASGGGIYVAGGTANLSTRRLLLLMTLLSAGGLTWVASDRCRAEPGPVSERDSAAPRFLAEWGSEGSAPGEFHFPIGIAINSADEIFVTDFYNDRVQTFSTEGKLLAAIPVLPNPGGIALGSSGDIYLAHFAEKKRELRTTDGISVYDSKGKLFRRWGQTGSNESEFDCPGGLAVDGEGHVYVADQTNRRVQVFDGTGKFLFKWGEHGTKTGQFGGSVSIRSRVGGPQFLAFDSKGNVYTTEGSEGRVQKFTKEGKFLTAWGDNEVKPGSFGGVFTGFKDRKATLQGPVAICIDKHDRVWVSAVCGRIQQFTSDGVYRRGFGADGTEPGQFYAPHGLAFDSRGHLYVVDAFNHRVQKFAVE